MYTSTYMYVCATQGMSSRKELYVYVCVEAKIRECRRGVKRDDGPRGLWKIGLLALPWPIRVSYIIVTLSVHGRVKLIAELPYIETVPFRLSRPVSVGPPWRHSMKVEKTRLRLHIYVRTEVYPCHHACINLCDYASVSSIALCSLGNFAFIYVDRTYTMQYRGTYMHTRIYGDREPGAT